MQLGASLGKRDWRWHCDRSYEVRLAGGRVHLFFIDTNPFVQRYYQTEWANFTGAARQHDSELWCLLLLKLVTCARPPVVQHHACPALARMLCSRHFCPPAIADHCPRAGSSGTGASREAGLQGASAHLALLPAATVNGCLFRRPPGAGLAGAADSA